VTLSSPEQAEAARGRLDGTLVDGRSITVRPFSSEPPTRGAGGVGPRVGGGGGGGGGPSRFQDTSDRTLYVGNLPYDCSETEVRELFSAVNAATPQRIHLPTDPTGRPRGFGFVTFTTAEDANNAITATRDAAVRGRRCVIHIAHKKGERPERPAGGGFGGGPRPRGPDMAEVWLATQGGGERRRREWGSPAEGEAGSEPGPGGPAPSTGGGGPGPGAGPPPRSKKRKGGDGERGGGRPKPKERGGAGRMRRNDDDY
jgi:hypothetical protein